MPLHAGFALVAALDQDLANDLIASTLRQRLGPLFFPLPQTIGAGPAAVALAGIVEVMPPRVELHVNPADLVATHFTFESTLRAQPAGGSTTSWRIRFNGTAMIGLIAQVQNDQVVVGLDTRTVSLLPLAVQVVSGPPLPAVVSTALQSADMASAATAYVRSLPPIAASPSVLRTRVQHVQPGSFKETGFSTFDWFRIDLTASRIVVRPLEAAIVIGLDYAGFTQGNPSDLADITRKAAGGAVYVRTVSLTVDSGTVPILVKSGRPRSNMAVAVNLSFLNQVVVRQVSPRIAGTPIAKHIRLDWINMGYAPFVKPLRGPEDGLGINFGVTITDTGTSVNGRFVLQPYLTSYQGSTNFIRPDYWSIHVGLVEIDLPWWISLAVVVLGMFFSAAVPVVGPFWEIGAIALLGSIIPTLIGNIENQTANDIRKSTNAVPFPPPWSGPLPGTTRPTWEGMVKYVSVTPESLDMGISTWIAWSDRAEPPPAVISPPEWEATALDPIPVTLVLRDDLERLGGGGIQLRWEVYRADTGGLVATAVTPYFPKPANGVLIRHHSPALYAVEAFDVRCTATVTLGSQVGEVWSGRQLVRVIDTIDRSRKYVQWGPHGVFFLSPGRPDQQVWWSHVRRSRIHRTAVRARCLMLRQKAARERELTRLNRRSKAPLTYTNTLPFPQGNLASNRKVLCEYCFFGSPQARFALPEEDWF
jgi:hypothetical protein